MTRGLVGEGSWVALLADAADAEEDADEDADELTEIIECGLLLLRLSERIDSHTECLNLGASFTHKKKHVMSQLEIGILVI